MCDLDAPSKLTSAARKSDGRGIGRSAGKEDAVAVYLMALRAAALLNVARVACVWKLSCDDVSSDACCSSVKALSEVRVAKQEQRSSPDRVEARERAESADRRAT